MEAIGSAIGIIIFIIAVILIIKFIKMLFTNFLISRILSAVCAFICLISGLVNCLGSQPTPGALWTGMVTAVFGWLFFIGPVVFDIEWDGTYNINWETGKVTPGWQGGFIMNFIGAALVVFFLYCMLAQDMPAIYIVVPLGLGIMNAYSFFKLR